MPKHKKAFCAADLKDRILTLDIVPGSDLDEASLAEEYGISRTPLREILHRLAGGAWLGLKKIAAQKSSRWTSRRCAFSSKPRHWSIVRSQDKLPKTGLRVSSLS
uniref:GntR family transcriptional regulator n=1 Tax=Yoonia rhodophyticola TaxID=3137370 RepID=A0AAN0NIY7_9RHOB